MKIDTNIKVNEINTNPVTEAINILNGRHNINIGGDSWKRLIDATAILITTGKALTDTGKAIEKELLDNVERPINKTTNKITKTTQLIGQVYNMTATYRDKAELNLNPDTPKINAMAEIINIAITNNCIEKIFKLELKKVDFEKIPQAMQDVLTKYGYSTREDVSMATPTKI